MSSEISILELTHLAYVSDRITSLLAVEAMLKDRVRKFFPEGTTRVETDAGMILVEVSPSGRDASLVSVRYEDG